MVLFRYIERSPSFLFYCSDIFDYAVIILVGAVLSGVGATVLSYPLLVVGEVIVGFGSSEGSLYQIKTSEPTR